MALHLTLLNCYPASSDKWSTCRNLCAGCPDPPAPVLGSVRLRGGFGTPCDPVHTGFVEVFNEGEWGAICNGKLESGDLDALTADVVCRQLGLPHGTVVNPLGRRMDSNKTDERRFVEEAAAREPSDRFWLSEVRCGNAVKDRLLDCDLRPGFQQGNAGCTEDPVRLTVACRNFPVTEALEAVATLDPGAGAPSYTTDPQLHKLLISEVFI